MSTPATNTVTKALIGQEDTARKQALVDYLKERETLSPEAEVYMDRKTW